MPNIERTHSQLNLFASQHNSTDNRGGDTLEQMCNALGVCPHEAGWPDKFGKALFDYIEKKELPQIRTLSLFSGAGGLDIGFHDLGFDIIESVEVEPKFCKTLQLNSGKGKKFTSSKVNCIDIRNYSGDNLGQIDFIIGGPPCQTFSAAGRRAAGVLGTTDARGVLFKEYVRLLKKLQPKGFLFENVYGIVGAQNGEAWREIQKSFSDVGYSLYYRILDAADYGVPQHRERLIIVGLREGTFEFPRPTHGPDSINGEPFYKAGLAVSGLQLSPEEKKTGITGRFGNLIDEIPPGLNYSYYTKEMGNPKPIFAWRSKFSDFMYKADPEMPVRTIKAQGGQYTGPLHWDSRYFALSEYKRLQTFPDDYEISGSKNVAVHQIGNSVPPQLARMMALAIRMEVFGTEFPFAISLLPQAEKLSFRSNKSKLTAYYRKKALESIRVHYPVRNATALPKDKTFFFDLTRKFDKQVDGGHGRWKVMVKWGTTLSIFVVPTSAREKSDKTVVIDIAPKAKWTLPVSSIEMTINSDNWFAVSAAWSVLDMELPSNHLKADLVQLNGYYQYDSQIRCMLRHSDLPGTDIMQTVYSGKVVSKNLTMHEVADIWHVKEKDVLGEAQRLRELGYEVRNRHTNPQIPDGILLIPYKFPTLKPESVQLNKTLF